MLNELHIENIAVIEKADIAFGRGLNILTGETGAGKSIVIDSIGAVLGERVSRELVRRGAEKGMVTAAFDVEGCEAWLKENEIEAEDEMIIQRRINSDGKSSCRVCGNPVTAAQLKELAALLVDIHGQNDGRQLMDERRHREYLDRFGTDPALLAAYRSAYQQYSGIKKELSALEMDEIEKERLSDSLSYQIQELERAELKAGEYDSLCARRDLLRNAEKLSEALDSALAMLAGDEDNAQTLTQNAAYYVGKASAYAPELESAGKSLNSAAFSLADAAESLRDFRENLDFSPDEYDSLETRIALLGKLQRKYTRDEEDLIAYLAACREKLDNIQYADERSEKLKKQLAAAAENCREAAARLSKNRQETAKLLEERIISELRQLNMPSVRFAVEFAPLGDDPGFDMKNVFAEKDPVATMIFDEIDTGVSGIAAQRVGEKLYCVSLGKQVMCVTHLPQIAAMADQHYLIRKQERDGRTYTDVFPLDREGRRQELARLHGGENITETTLLSAEEQLEGCERFKAEIGVKA